MYRGLRVSREFRVLRVYKVSRVCWVLRVSKVSRVSWVSKVLKDYRVFKASKVFKDHKDRLVSHYQLVLQSLQIMLMFGLIAQLELNTLILMMVIAISGLS